MERAIDISETSGPKNLYGKIDGITPAVEQAIIGRSLVIKGEIGGVEALYIDGRVEGKISVPGNRVTIGPQGSVLSDIQAREVVVMGTVKGNLNCSERADIRNGCSVVGEIVAKRLSIEDGAMIKGSVVVRREEPVCSTQIPKTEPDNKGAAAPHKDAGNGRPQNAPSDQSAAKLEGSSVLLSVK